MMDHFNYHKGTLHVEDVAIQTIAQDVGTPFYCYSSSVIERNYRIFKSAFGSTDAMICFAVKANSNIAVLSTLAKLGAGADTVSEGEIRRAITAGIPAERIVFSGVGKTRREMEYALGVGVYQFNIESFEELSILDEVALEMGKKAPVAIRVNPDVDAKTHEKISTGRRTDKFGVPWSQIHEVFHRGKELEHINIVGLTMHIGSQVTTLDPYDLAYGRMRMLVKELRKIGHNITRIDFGGGLGITYDNETPPDVSAYAKNVISHSKDLDCSIILEPGRWIVGNAGMLITTLIYTKRTPYRNFAIVDAAMNDLMRPALYQAFHDVIPVEEDHEIDMLEVVDVVGPVCESADAIGAERELPYMEPGTLLAIRSAGAYSAVMSSTYNSRLLVPEIMVKGEQYATIRKRPTYEEMIGLDIVPDWV